MLAMLSNTLKRFSPALLCVIAGALGLINPAQSASPEETQSAIKKANAYIETVKNTERAVESWERYQSWVNMKTGPTGKERYVTYGMYDLYDVAGLLKEAREATGAAPLVPKLDQAMARYIAAYEALAPVMTEGAGYYDSQAYVTDKMAKGKALHSKLVPLATTFLAERDATMPELRVFVRAVEADELVALEASEGRSVYWLVGQVVHQANRVWDVFPRERPQPMTSEMFEAEFKALGPDTPGEKFDELIAGVVKPREVVIDVKRFGEALDGYAKAVEAFDAYAGEKPEDFDELKPLPRQLLEMLRAFQKPLAENEGREFEDSGRIAGALMQAYIELSNAASPVWQSHLRYLP